MSKCTVQTIMYLTHACSSGFIAVYTLVDNLLLRKKLHYRSFLTSKNNWKPSKHYAIRHDQSYNIELTSDNHRQLCVIHRIIKNFVINLWSWNTASQEPACSASQMMRCDLACYCQYTSLTTIFTISRRHALLSQQKAEYANIKQHV